MSVFAFTIGAAAAVWLGFARLVRREDTLTVVDVERWGLVVRQREREDFIPTTEAQRFHVGDALDFHAIHLPIGRRSRRRMLGHPLGRPSDR